ncbi:MAG: 2OG-Fe dioxygenase family protein [Bauldia sp.]|nr:2OG-Fe dioxygenase family protein [Bauldia sp.]
MPAQSIRTIDAAAEGRRGLALVASNDGATPPHDRFRDQLHRDGFVAMAAASLGSPAMVARATRGLRDLAADLPADPYCKGGYRYRRYARLFLMPWSDTLVSAPLEWSADRRQPVFTYQQPAALNSEEAGSARKFPAVPQSVLASDWMEHIIRFDFAQLRFTADEMNSPIQVGVHVVEMRPSPGVEAVASPNRVHRDGEHYTCAHLISRDGIVGGENHIVDPAFADREIADVPAAAIRSAFVLVNPLDGYIVRDDRVAHHVAGVRLADGSTAGSRKILLIDFTPMQPYVLMQPAA